MSDSRPNMLFITCHDLGRHLGAYGRSSVVSPALDELASSGVRFDQAFSTAPICCPARAALHTGRYPHSTGMLGFLFEPFNWALNEGERHLAGYLAENGYHTAQIGYQHVVKAELREQRAALGFAHVSSLEPDATAPQVAQEASEYLRSYRDDRPFYLEVGFFEVHTRWDLYPLVGWGETEVSKGIEVPAFLPERRATRAQAAGLQGAVRKLDQGIRSLLEALRDSGREADTWVIFVTDHGLPLPGAKGTLYDPGIEVSLIMRWPNAGLSGGRTVPQLVSNVDIVPTILEALDIPAPATIEGRSLWPLLQQRAYRERECIYAESTFGLHYEPMRCVRTSRHKLIFIPEMSPSIGSETDGVFSEAFQDYLTVRPYFRRPVFELYDLQEDPLERNNLAGGRAHWETERHLIADLRSWMESTIDPLLQGPIISPRYRQAMAALRGNRNVGDG